MMTAPSDWLLLTPGCEATVNVAGAAQTVIVAGGGNTLCSRHAVTAAGWLQLPQGTWQRHGSCQMGNQQRGSG